MTRVSRAAALATWLATLAAPLQSQQQTSAPARFPSPPTGAEATDSARAAWLHAHGHRATGKLVDMWYTPGSLAPAHARALVDSLDSGLAALQRFFGGPYPWQRLGDARVRLYVPADRFIAHMNGPNDSLDVPAAFISAARVQVGPAPYLHESAHVMLMPTTPFFYYEYPDSARLLVTWRDWPQWLVEGFPEYAAHEVARTLPFPEGDVWTYGGNAGVDSSCAARASGPRGAEILTYVGTWGYAGPVTGPDRRVTAPIFYACASSFSKYLVNRTDSRFVASLFNDFLSLERRIAERTGRSLAALRTEWLTSIGYDARSATAQPVSIAVSGAPALAADLYGGGERGVVMLAHGGYSTRSSWEPQARQIADFGFRVLVVEARAAADLAAGRETPCLYDDACLARDVLAGVNHLRSLGATSVALVGGSMGGAAVARAAVDAPAGAIQKIVLLAPAPIQAAERIPGNKLFIVAAGDANSAGPRLPGIRQFHDRTPAPKRLLIREGSAHGQLMFQTADGEAVARQIVAFLRQP